MKRFVGYAIALGTLVGAGALLYTFGLSDEAKDGVRGAAQSVRDAYESVSQRMSDLYGTGSVDDVASRQREVAHQWEDLGF